MRIKESSTAKKELGKKRVRRSILSASDKHSKELSNDDNRDASAFKFEVCDPDILAGKKRNDW